MSYKKNLTVVFLSIILMSSCKNVRNDKKNLKVEQNHKIINKNIQTPINIKSSEVKKVLSKNQFIGVWAENEDENALFEMTKDSIRYVEYYNTPYYFDIKNDSLIIFLDENFISKVEVIKVNKDSLVYRNEFKITRLYKREE